MVFNTADVVSDEVITTLEVDIVSFMSFLHNNWPEVRITPKLHILEDHVASFLRTVACWIWILWGTGWIISSCDIQEEEVQL